MNRRRDLPARVLPAALLVGLGLSAAPRAFAQAPRQRPASSSAFEENRGQIDRRVQFVSRGKPYTLLLTSDAAILAREGGRASIRMQLQGAAPQASGVGLDRLSRKVYYATSDSTGPLTAVSTFGRVKYSGIYRGVDLEFYDKERQLEFDFTVAPHADPRQISLSFAGVDRVSLSRDGELHLRRGEDDVVLKRPVVYQRRDGVREEVEAGYVLTGAGRQHVRFAIDRYDRSLPLVIDPTIVYATYSGREGDESIVSTEVSATGDVYLFGSATALPVLGDLTQGPIPPVGIIAGTTDPQYPPLYCFVQKLTANGTDEAYQVYFQGFRTCETFGVAPSGAVHLAMQAPYSFAGFAQLRTLTDDGSGSFTGVSVTNLNGGSLSSIAGRPSVVRDIKADGSGNVYVLYQQLVQADSALQSRLMKVDAQGSLVGTIDVGSPQFSATLGDEAIAIAVDENGQAFVAGNTNGHFPTTLNAFEQPHTIFDCSEDGFLAQVDTTATPFRLPYASVVGGTGCDAVLGIARDDRGFIHLTGRTLSADFPMAAGAFQPSPNLADGVGDGFIVSLDLSRQGPDQLIGGSFMGVDLFGSANGLREPIHPLAVLEGDALAVTGATSPSMPLVNALFDASQSNLPFHPFVEVFTADGSGLLMASHLDHSGLASHAVIAGDSSGGVYAVIETTEHDLSTPGVIQIVPGGGTDLLVSKFDLSDILPNHNNPPVVAPINPIFENASSPAGASLSIIASATDPDNDPLTVTFAGPLGAVIVPNSPAGFYGATLDFPLGTSTLTVTADDGRGGIGSTSTQMTVLGAVSTSSGTVVIDWPPTAPLFDGDQIADASYLPNVQLTIQNATGAGVATMNIDSGATPAPPTGYQFGSPPYRYFFSSTIPAAGPYTVCIDLAGMSFADPDSRMFYANPAAPAWTDVTVSSAAGEICGQTAALGLFAILTPASPANQATTIAGSGFTVGGIDGTGGDPRDDVIDGGQATASALQLFSGGLAFDQTNGLLYTTTFAGIRRVDVNTGILDTIGGDGALGGFVVDPVDGSVGVAAIDDVDARQSHITNPFQLALDPQGNLYIADYCRVRRIDRATNIITTVAGDGFCRHRGDGGPAIAASIFRPFALAFDAAGDLLIGESWTSGGYVRRVDTNGLISTVAGNGSLPLVPGSALQSGLPTISRMAIAPNGDVYLATQSDALLRLSAGADHVLTGSDPGEQISVVNSCVLTACAPSKFRGDGGPVRSATFADAYSLSVEPNGDLLVGDIADHRIRRISAGADSVVTGNDDDEIVWTVAGFNPSTLNQGAAFDNDGNGYGLSSALIAATEVLVDPRGGFFFGDEGSDQVRRVGAPPVVGPSADLSVPSVTAPALVHQSVPFTFTVTVSNAGPSPATNVKLSFERPADLQFVSSDAGCGGQRVIICNLGTLASGASDVVHVVVTPASGSISTVVTVSSDVPDPNAANDSAALNTTADGILSLKIAESIHVRDDVRLAESVVLSVRESIHVMDGTLAVAQRLTPQMSLGSTSFPSSITGQPITFTATVAAGASTPTGLVTFVDGVTVLGSAPLAGGVARFTTSALAAGTHAIKAQYAGDANFTPAGASLSQVVAAPFVQLTAAATFTRDHAGQLTAAITVRNTGNVAAAAAQLAAIQLNATAGSPGAAALGAIPAGGSVTVIETFPPSAGAPGPGSVLKTTLIWNGGSVTGSLRVTLP